MSPNPLGCSVLARRARSQRLQRVDGREWIVEKTDAVDFD
jgi:hypothetical protein